MTKALFSNNAFSTLASGITDSATSLTVATGDGALFPTISGTNYFYATLIDTSNNLEIVQVTAVSTDTFTVTRGAESTTARAYSAGDRIELRLTAAGLTNVVDQAEDWATKTDGIVDATDYSAKAYAIGGTGVTDTATRGAAKEWAIETSGTVDGTDYSAKEHAVGTQTRGASGGGSSKDWASYTVGTVDDTEYSAKYYSQQASTSAANASTSETNAATAQTAAEAAQTAAEAAADNFDDVYLGSKAADPTLDNDGDPLTEGDLYWNSVSKDLRVYNGTAWVAYSAAGGQAYVSANDTTLGYLNGKLVAGSGVTLTENNDGGNETLTISSSGASVGLVLALGG